ncbi:MAG: hypothetical protein WB992_05010 [Bryobacteraceae bacterium]
MDVVKPSASEVEEQLARILTSPQFHESPRLQTFLRFVVSLSLEGKADQIKESTIASEVFGRTDVRDDSIVRSAAGRLRSRLEEYYQQTGASDAVRIVIPKGSYVPEIRELPPLGLEGTPGRGSEETSGARASASGLSTPHKSLGQPTRPTRKLWWAIAASAVLAIAATGAILWREHAGADHHANLEARELYLKGRYYWSKRTPDDLNRAVDYFTQAIVKDPRDAEAYVGLADSYNLLSEYTAMPYQEAFKRAIAAAKTAIELDGNLPEAHNSLAFASFYGDWDAVTAEREFRRALELNPNDGTAHHWYATFLMSVGREREALAEIERSQALEPSSQSIVADKGLILFYTGQVEPSRTPLEGTGSQ